MVNKRKAEYNIANILFMVLTPIIGVFGTIWWISSGSFNYPTLVLTLIWATLIEVSITGGYHRLFSHRTYEANVFVQLFFLVFGAGAFQGSALNWSLDHRNHHKYVDDNERDPYSINKGFLWAHILWLFYKSDYQREGADIKAPDLFQDKLILLQDRTWVAVGAFVCFVLPAMIAGLWGDFWGGLLIAGVARAVVNHHSTFLINSLSHCVGKQTYSDKHSARDNWFTALLTFGEGYHNYHHEFSSDYRNGVRFYQWDPTKWLIYGLSLFGLTKNLKRIREEVIVKKRIQMREKHLKKQLSTYSESFMSIASRILTRLKERVENSARRLSELRNQGKNIEAALADFNYRVRAWNRTSKRLLRLAPVTVRA